MKNHLLPVSMMMSLFISINLNLYAQSGLIGCFPLDNNSNDHSNNNHGIAYNLTGATDRFGNPNQAYHFSGTNSAILLDDSLYRINNYTYSVWFKLDVLPSNGAYFCIMTVGGDIADQVLLVGNDPASGNVGIGGGSYDSSGTPHSYYSGVMPNNNQWYHLVVTRDNDSVKLFIDNALIGFNHTGIDAGYNGNQHNACFGARHDTTFQNFIGDIDEIKIFKRVFTNKEITLIDTSCNSISGISRFAPGGNFISVFPNPFTKDFEIKGTSVQGEFLLLDELGKEIMHQKTIADKTSINIEDIKPGIYFLRYIEQDQITNTKLIKF